MLQKNRARSPGAPAGGVGPLVGPLLVLLTAAVSWGLWGYSYDDNYITYRYAANVLAGVGLVYNPGEVVLGTSAPGYALVLAGLGFLMRPLDLGIHHAGTLTTALSWLALFAVIFATPSSWPRPRRTALLLGFAAVVFCLRLNVQLAGAEAFPVMALVVVAAHALLTLDRPVAAGLAVAAAMMLRLDAGLAALALGLVAWGSGRRLPLAYGLAGTLPLAAWLAWLQVTFGRIVPITLEGKTALREVPYTWRQWQMLDATLPRAAALVFVAVAASGLLLMFGGERLWRRPLFLALGSWLLGHEIAYRAIGVWFAPWYHVALVHAAALLFVFGALELGRLAAGHRRRAGAGRIAAALLAVLLLAVVVLPSLRDFSRGFGAPADPRYRVYAAAGAYLREVLPRDAEVLALEIGVLGYFSERRILDYGALVSPRMTAAKFTGRRAELAAELAPAYIVAAAGHGMIGEAVDHPDMRGRYRAVAVFRDPLFAHGEVRVLERRPDR